MPAVSVIIPAYNAERFLDAAVESALGQTFADLDVWVVDDGSTDATAGVARRRGGRVHYLRQANAGPAAARNRGVAASAGELIAFLDADDLWRPDKIAAQVEALAARPAAAFCYTDAERFDERGPLAPPPDADLRRSGFLWDLLLLRDNVIPLSSVLVRRRRLAAAGPFDEARELIAAEDYDLLLRLTARWEAVYLPGPYVRYRCTPAGLSRGRIAPSYAAAERVVRRAAARPPEGVRVPASALRRRLHRLHADHALDQLGAGQRGMARRQFARALAAWPFVPRTWSLLALASLPPAIAERLRAWRRAIVRPAPESAR